MDAEELTMVREMEKETLQSIFEDEFTVVSELEWKIVSPELSLVLKLDDQYPLSLPKIAFQFLQTKSMHKQYIEIFVEGKLNEKAKEMEGQSMVFSLFEFAKDFISTLEELHNGSFAFFPVDILVMILAHNFLTAQDISMREILVRFISLLASLGASSKTMMDRCRTDSLWRVLFARRFAGCEAKNEIDSNAAFFVQYRSQLLFENDSKIFVNKNRKHEPFVYKFALSVRERIATGDTRPPTENWKEFLTKELLRKQNICLVAQIADLSPTTVGKKEKEPKPIDLRGFIVLVGPDAGEAGQLMLGSYEFFEEVEFINTFSIIPRLNRTTTRCKFVGNSLGWLGLSFSTEEYQNKFMKFFVLEARGTVWSEAKKEGMPTILEFPIWFSYEVVDEKQKSIDQLGESQKRNKKNNANQALSLSKLNTLRIKYDANYNSQDIVLISPLKQSTTYYREILKRISENKKRGTNFGNCKIDFWVLSTLSCTDWVQARNRYQNVLRVIQAEAGDDDSDLEFDSDFEDESEGLAI